MLIRVSVLNLTPLQSLVPTTKTIPHIGTNTNMIYMTLYEYFY